MHPGLGNSPEILYLQPEAGSEKISFTYACFKGPIAQSVRATDS